MLFILGFSYLGREMYRFGLCRMQLGFLDGKMEVLDWERGLGIEMSQDVIVSIIVVSFQAGDKLRATVESVLAQSEKRFEVIVKDGGSTDGSVEALPIDERIHVFVEKDQGIYDAMNQAIGYARGAYLLFLNCGDYLFDQNTLEKVGRQLKGSGIFYGHTFNRKLNAEVTMNGSMSGFSCYRHIPCHQACFYARELFEERGYDTKYRIRADYEHFLWCYFEKKVNVLFLDQVVSSYEGDGFSEQKENIERDKEEHREITLRYMGWKRVLWYQFLLVISLVHVRRFFGNSPVFAKGYNRVKKIFYKV